MKPFIYLNFNCLKLKNAISANIGFLILCFILTFQNLPLIGQTGPGLNWNRDHWYGMDDNIEQDESGEDWYYDISTYSEEDIIVGYVAAGYSSTLNDFGSFNCMDCGEFAVECDEFESENFKRGCVYPKLAEMDKNGEVEWYEIYTKGQGWFRQVIQLDDESGYIAVGQIKYDGGENPGDLAYYFEGDPYYLPECAVPEGHIPGDPIPKYELMYVVKTDMEGEILEEAVYGIANPGIENLIDFTSDAYGVIQDDDGNLIIAGYAEKLWNNPITMEDEKRRRGYVVALNPTTLMVEYENILYEDDNFNSHSTCLIEMDDDFYVFSTKKTAEIPELYGHIFINRLSNSLADIGTAFEITSTEEPDLDGLPSYCTSVAYDVIIDDGDLVTAVLVNRTNDVQSVTDEGLVHVYRIHPGTTPEWTFEANLSIVDDEETELFRAYDLKVGITNTSDGGFAVTSTLHDTDLFEDDVFGYEYYNVDCDPLTPDEQFCDCDLYYDDTKTWNSNPYIAKFDNSDILEWRNAYIVTDGYGTYYPNDIKRLECVYEILQDDEGGFILTGNNSKNFDDDFVYRVFDECNINQTYTGTYDLVDPEPINESVVWSNNAKIKGIVTIQSGGTLTIKDNAIIQFADSKAANHDTYIRVKRGGRLIIEGGAKLTGNTTCGTMWEGIYVEGTSGTSHPTPSAFISASYTNSNHGFVWIKGDAIIENARTAISLGLTRKFIPPVTGNWGGGIIIADDAHFINNTTDIEFYPYTHVNRSLIRNSEFLTNSALADVNEIPQAHIEMKIVKGVNIRGNHFENSVDDAIYYGAERGVAVKGTDAAFKFNDNPNAFGATGGAGSAPNTVIDLYYGIYATQFTVAADNIVIDANTFEENVRSIYLGGTELAEVNLNAITMPAKSNYGLYLDASTDYGVEENYFTGSGATNPIGQTGIVINDNGTSNNRIYRNAFTDIAYGIKAQNSNGNTTSGIFFKCNTFDENKYDIAVTSGGIKKDQGECVLSNVTTPAGNLFTDNLTTSTLQFAANSGVDEIIYHHHNDANSSTAPFYEPYEFSTSIITLDECTENFNSTNSCPEDFSDGGGSRLGNSAPRGVVDYNLNLKEIKDSLSQFFADIERNKLIRYYLDSEQIAELSTFLSTDSSSRAASLNAVIAMKQGNYEAASSNIQLIDENINSDEFGYSNELYSILNELNQDTLSWFDMNAEQFEKIKQLSTKNNRIGVVAKLILEEISSVPYEEPLEEINLESDEDYKEQSEINETGAIQIYPHPVGSQSVIEILLSDLPENSRFIIYDLHGKVLFNYDLLQQSTLIIVNNDMLTSGLYLGVVTSNNMIKQSIKFVVNE